MIVSRIVRKREQTAEYTAETLRRLSTLSVRCVVDGSEVQDENLHSACRTIGINYVHAPETAEQVAAQRTDRVCVYHTVAI